MRLLRAYKAPRISFEAVYHGYRGYSALQTKIFSRIIWKHFFQNMEPHSLPNKCSPQYFVKSGCGMILENVSPQRHHIICLLRASSAPLLWLEVICAVHVENVAINAQQSNFNDAVFRVLEHDFLQGHIRACLLGVFQTPTVCSHAIQNGWREETFWNSSESCNFSWSNTSHLLTKPPSHNISYYCMILRHQCFVVDMIEQHLRSVVLFQRYDELYDYS